MGDPRVIDLNAMRFRAEFSKHCTQDWIEKWRDEPQYLNDAAIAALRQVEPEPTDHGG